jgi:hypothetical protein
MQDQHVSCFPHGSAMESTIKELEFIVCLEMNTIRHKIISFPKNILELTALYCINENYFQGTLKNTA